MSDDPKSKKGEWTMPAPIFRSTKGYTPKTAAGYIGPDEIDTASPDFFEADTDEIGTETPDENQTPASPLKNHVRPTAPQKSAGCAKTFGLIVALVAVSVAAVLIVIV